MGAKHVQLMTWYPGWVAQTTTKGVALWPLLIAVLMAFIGGWPIGSIGLVLVGDEAHLSARLDAFFRGVRFSPAAAN